MILQTKSKIQYKILIQRKDKKLNKIKLLNKNIDKITKR